MIAQAPVFTADWRGYADYWPALFREIAGSPDLRFLEVGCFEGRATLWLLDNVLTDPSSSIVAVDTFEGSPEFDRMGIDGNSRDRFEANLAGPIQDGTVTVLQGDSKQVLRDLPASELFDFVYIDGSHRAPDVLADAVLVWPLLRPGGGLAFDDYGWGLTLPETERPRLAIDAFLAVYAAELKVRHSDYQVAVEKL